ncbi:MAG: glycosyltransferase family 9 protein, partial [Anaerolineae bacterium]|nr:glycosyltransferase family 9 protein [Anaerolineae bacterium]
AYPAAHITWAVGSWSKGVIEHHDLLDAVLDTGEAALPVKSRGDLRRFAKLLRAGHYDLAVSLVRSPLMSLALLLSGIRWRAGLDSDGRGFGYNIRAAIDPNQPRHEAEIYLDVARALGLNTDDCWANVPVFWTAREEVRRMLSERDIREPFVIVNPAGGRNPGMVMDAKRWPPEHFAALADRLAARWNVHTLLLGGPGDGAILDAVRAWMQNPPPAFAGEISFEQIAALASLSMLYVGNDTGMTHLAAAAGARTAMILGPSDPTRYAPFSSRSIALWKPTQVVVGGVAQGVPRDWDWLRDGISVDEAESKIIAWMNQSQ